MNIKRIENETNEQAALSLKLRKASDAYYGGTAIMSDIEFDKELEKLQQMEQASGFVYDISPSISVGATVVDALEKSEHEHPALSLDKVKYKDREKLTEWLQDKEGVLSWKMDGLTAIATYDYGKLTKVVTRGNGTIGSVITHNAVYFEGLPLTINYKNHLIVRGECTMTNEEFVRVNDEAGGIYENARNLASATIQMLDSNESRKRKIQFTAFKLVTPTDLPTESERFKWLASLGFTVVENEVVTADSILDTIEKWKEKVTTNASPTDGLVLSFNDQVYADSLGDTGHHPRGSIALKWTDETAESTIRSIHWSVGKTGVITPVAVFVSIRLGLGSTVTRASLHNLSIARNMPSDGGTAVCGVGSKVQVYMANMIIPQIASCTEGELEIPTICPSCGKPVKVIERNGVETLNCINPDCPTKHIKQIATFASKDGMNIEGLSETRIEYLIENGYIHDELDFYRLSDNQELLDRLKCEDGWGEKSVQNLLDSVEKSRDTDLTHFLYSLSIPLLGHDLSKKLTAYFDGDIDNFIAYVKNPVSLSDEDGIGPVKSQNLEDWCRACNISHLEELIAELHFMKKEKATAALSGLTFVITGSVHVYKNRDEFKASVEARGGKVSGSVSGKTNFLVNNDVTSTSGKNKKAKELNIPIISEDDFINRFGK